MSAPQEFIKSTLASMGHHELCLPGRVLHLTKTASGTASLSSLIACGNFPAERRCCLNYPTYSLRESGMEAFAEIDLSPTMAADHLPDRYFFELNKLLSQQWK